MFFNFHYNIFGFSSHNELSFNHILQCLALQRYSGYRPSELKECILAIHDLQLNRKGSSLQAIRDKYKQHKVLRLHISLVILLFLLNWDVYTKSKLKRLTISIETFNFRLNYKIGPYGLKLEFSLYGFRIRMLFKLLEFRPYLATCSIISGF